MADERPARVAAAADASFLIGVCLVGQLPLLEALFERIYVAPAVWEEVVVRGQGRPGAERRSSHLGAAWVEAALREAGEE